MMGDRVITSSGVVAPEFMGVPAAVFGVPLAMLLAAAALVAAFWRGGTRLRPTVPLVAAGLLLAWSGLSLARASYVYPGLLTLGFLGAGLAVAAALSVTCRRPGAALGVAAALTFSASLVALAGLAEFVERWEAGNPAWRVFGPFVNPDFLAGYLVMAVPVSASLFLAAGVLPDGPGPGERAPWTWSKPGAVAAIVAALVAAVGLLLVVSMAAGAAALRFGAHGGAGTIASVVVRLALAAGLAVAIVRMARLGDLGRIAPRALTALAAVGTATQALCLLLTQSRLGLGALGVALVVLAGLALRGRALRGAARTRALAMAGLVLAVAVVGAKPVIGRLLASRGERHSADFRFYTWRGTEGMIRTHPVLGTGLGSFETAYPGYAIVDYTQHAHESFLHLAAEAGVPAAGFLVVGLVAVAVIGARWVVTRRSEAAGDGPPPGVLLACGLVAAATGAVTHNLFDSDLYIPANAIFLCAVCGLTLGLARARDAEAGGGAERQTGVAVVRWLAVAAAVVLAARGTQLMLGRSDASAAQAAIAAQPPDLPAAISSLSSAASVEPANPEYRMQLASFYEAAREPLRAREQYEAAARTAPIGKTFYRLGRFLAREGQAQEAIGWYERARQKEPHNLQTLLALAEACRAAQQPARAEAVDRYVVDLRPTPFGRVRALPELPDWEFGIAHADLAEAELARGDTSAAERDLREAIAVLGEVWRTRKDDMALARLQGDRRDQTTARYEWAMIRLAALLEARGDRAGATEVQARLARFQAEKAADAAPPGQ